MLRRIYPQSHHQNAITKQYPVEISRDHPKVLLFTRDSRFSLLNSPSELLLMDNFGDEDHFGLNGWRIGI